MVLSVSSKTVRLVELHDRALRSEPAPRGWVRGGGHRNTDRVGKQGPQGAAPRAEVNQRVTAKDHTVPRDNLLVGRTTRTTESGPTVGASAGRCQGQDSGAGERHTTQKPPKTQRQGPRPSQTWAEPGGSTVSGRWFPGPGAAAGGRTWTRGDAVRETPKKTLSPGRRESAHESAHPRSTPPAHFTPVKFSDGIWCAKYIIKGDPPRRKGKTAAPGWALANVLLQNRHERGPVSHGSTREW